MHSYVRKRERGENTREIHLAAPLIVWITSSCRATAGQRRTASTLGFFHCTAFERAFNAYAPVSGVAGKATNAIEAIELVTPRGMHARLVSGPGDLPMSPGVSYHKPSIGEEY